MKPRNLIYLGDHNLDPPEDKGECGHCDGWGYFEEYGERVDCPLCSGMTSIERRQKAFEEFDPPDNYCEDL